MKWRTYPAYRNSGVEWLGEIPEHWNVYRLRMLLRDFEGIKIGPFGSALKLEYMQDDGYKVYGQEHLINADFSLGYKYVDENKFKELIMCEILPGDLVVSMMGTTGKCQVVPEHIERGIMDSHLLRLRTNDLIFPSYLASLVDDSDYIRHQITTNGKGSIMEGLNSSIIKELLIMLPPLAEQHAIAVFVDRETARIDELIAKKQRQIDLLQEKRSALISHVVTKGLDPDVKMKDSGVEWLGEIPEHWKALPLKFVCSHIKDGTHLPPERRELGVPLLSVRNIVNGSFVFLADDSLISEEDYRLLTKTFEPKRGDVLLAIVGATMGKVAVVEEMGCFAIQRSLAVLRAKSNTMYFKFLSYFLQSRVFQGVLWRNVAFSAQPGIYLGTVANLRCPIPPVEEQVNIVSFVDRELLKIETMLAKVEKGLDLFQEYRTALISAAVTGKIDVRQEIHA